MARKTSDSTVRRLSRYLRRLRKLDAQDRKVVSSRELAETTGTTAAQVRKDLSHFGSFGKRGQGYSVGDLRVHLEEILGLDHRWTVAVLGIGKIGSALLGYGYFTERGFDIAAAFDSDPSKIGSELGGVRIQPLNALEEAFREHRISIAIIATPVEAAQDAASRAVSAGARAILNFAPIKLSLPEGVALREMDVTLELEGLCYLVTEASTPADGPE
ncbi:MAG: redox-sensing transcriptional repressor Rex [marine benthic group bacterium]|jgi:redox-sensing transcriptional repressor|nr:redox-sensing transcriptional repressor Rex [Candidatus Benthicola marisminoris]